MLLYCKYYLKFSADDYARLPCLKLLTDMYSNPDTVDIFYTNDLNVLVDVLIREIKNLGEGDKVSSFIIFLISTASSRIFG